MATGLKVFKLLQQPAGPFLCDVYYIIIMIGWSSSRRLVSHKCDQGLDLREMELPLLFFVLSHHYSLHYYLPRRNY